MRLIDKMTKDEIIEFIYKKREEAFKRSKEFERNLGCDSIVTRETMGEWMGILELCLDLTEEVED